MVLYIHYWHGEFVQPGYIETYVEEVLVHYVLEEVLVHYVLEEVLVHYVVGCVSRAHPRHRKCTVNESVTSCVC